MTRTNCIVLHKYEWERLKTQGTPPQKSKKQSEKDEYLRYLQEKSQSWIKKWPDSVEGHISKLEEIKEKQRLSDIALINQFKTKQKNAKKNDMVEKTRQMIFENSCYGRRLISALLESKALEERDIQVEFQKKLLAETKERDKETNALGCSLHNALDMENREKEEAMRNREKNKETAEINKAMYLAKNEINVNEQERQRLCKIQNMQVIKQIIERESIEEEKKKMLLKQDLEQSFANQKETEERRKQREVEDERKAKQWKDYVERRNHKIEMVYKKTLLNTTQQSSANFELVDKLRKEKAARYDEFVNAGIEKLRTRELAQNKEDAIKIQNKLNIEKLIMESNKKIAELKVDEGKQNICVCDKQCLITKSENNSKIDTPRIQLPSPARCSAKVKKEKPGWSGISDTHAYFAKEADSILKECRYKNMARKVVDDYRRQHNLNSESLPVSNYF